MQHDTLTDDLAGLPLDPDLCRAARAKEISYFRSKGAWELRGDNKARPKMGRSLISVRWVKINKGDDASPNKRCRFVARELPTGGQDAIFAPHAAV